MTWAEEVLASRRRISKDTDLLSLEDPPGTQEAATAWRSAACGRDHAELLKAEDGVLSAWARVAMAKEVKL